MRMFDEVVNDITKDGYCVELDKDRLRQVFEMLTPEIRWEGTYYGWNTSWVWPKVCETVHEYMKEWHC